MAISTLLFFRVARDLWNWKLVAAASLCTLFLAVDLSFFGANIIKFADGGWVPIAVAALVYALMTTWKIGRTRLAALVQQSSLPIDLFLADVAKRPPTRVPGTAIFLTSAMDIAPPVLLHHLKHNKVLHQRVILLSMVTEEVPQVPAAERVEYRDLGEGFWRVVGHYGFMESPDVPALLTQLGESEAPGTPGRVFLTQTSFFLGRETLIAVPNAQRPKRLPGEPRRMAYWRRKLFIIMTRNARSATAFFGLPPNRVVELGAQIQI
jgi:KUP system potassium uptake protein